MNHTQDEEQVVKPTQLESKPHLELLIPKATHEATSSKQTPNSNQSKHSSKG